MNFYKNSVINFLLVFRGIWTDAYLGVCLGIHPGFFFKFVHRLIDKFLLILLQEALEKFLLELLHEFPSDFIWYSSRDLLKLSKIIAGPRRQTRRNFFICLLNFCWKKNMTGFWEISARNTEANLFENSGKNSCNF